MFANIRPRRGSTTEWSTINPVLLEGELAIEYPDSGIGTGFCKFKLGDGYTEYNDLSYAFDANAARSIYGGNASVSNDICLRTATTEEWEAENPVLKLGEIVFDKTAYAYKSGDGEHTFTELDYIGYVWELDKDYNFGDLDDPEILPEDKDYDFGDLDSEVI